jgi:predicted nucleotidyltransferase
MISNQLAAEISRRLVAAVHPRRVIVFGSHAVDSAVADSDVDLLVVTNRPAEERFSVAASACKFLFGLGTPFDVLVCTAGEARQAGEAKTGLMRQVLDERRVIHGER